MASDGHNDLIWSSDEEESGSNLVFDNLNDIVPSQQSLSEDQPHEPDHDAHGTDTIERGTEDSGDVQNRPRNLADFAIQPGIRGKKRKKLCGHGCPDCVAYLKTRYRSVSELARVLNDRSRHRSTALPNTTTFELNYGNRPPTPPGFWSLDMPTTPEAIEQGLMRDETIRQQSHKSDGDRSPSQDFTGEVVLEPAIDVEEHSNNNELGRNEITVLDDS